MLGFDFTSGLPMIAIAGVSAYIASKALADALCGGDRDQPGLLAIGHWVPIAIIAAAGAWTDQTEIALGLVFSTAVACLSLAAGAVAFLAPVQLATTSRRSWAMLVPASVMTFLVGIHGQISPLNAALFALEGLVVLMLWTDRAPTAGAETLPVARPGRGWEFRSIQTLLAIALAGIAAWFDIRGTRLVASHSEYATPALLTATLIGPLLVLPIIGTGTELAHQNQSAVAIGSQVGVALLNLCGLIPLAMVISFIHQAKLHGTIRFDFTFPFPLAIWRVDVILLIVLSLLLLPVALGRWSLSRGQGLLMMLGYLFYLVLTLAWQRYAMQGVAR
jgi:cation:H+ antiporter